MSKKLISIICIFVICVGAPIIYYVAESAMQNTISDSNVAEINDLWLQNGWIDAEDVKHPLKLEEDITRFEFVKWILKICDPEVVTAYNMHDLQNQGSELNRFAIFQEYIDEESDLQAFITCYEAVIIANKAFGTHESIVFFDISPDEKTAEYQIYEKPLTKQEIIIFLEKLRNSTPKMNVSEQKSGIFASLST